MTIDRFSSGLVNLTRVTPIQSVDRVMMLTFAFSSDRDDDDDDDDDDGDISTVVRI